MAGQSVKKSSWIPQEIPKVLIIDPRQLTDNILNYETKSKVIRLFQVFKRFSEKWFSHVMILGLLILYAFLGAWIFQAIEGSNERSQKKLINEMRDNVIEQLIKERMKYTLPDGRYAAPRMPDAWVRRVNQLMDRFERRVNESCQVHGITTDSEQIKWSFWGGLFFSMTVFTTIGYGNITPKTTAGRAATMIYAFFGIPILLMVLADFGKLFTRGIKFVFKYIRRLYYTRSVSKMRKVGRQATEGSSQYMIAAIDAVNKGIAYIPYAPKIPTKSEADEKDEKEDKTTKKKRSKAEGPYPARPYPGYKTPKYWYAARHPGFNPEAITPWVIGPTPPTTSGDETGEATTPVPDDLEQMVIDDEFDLPITVAVVFLILYLMLGAVLFWMWEDWTMFEAFYFVFISMSTIGFGDLIPDHPKIMISTFIYLIFGLALTSMCINVVQEKLSSTFQRAKMTIGESIGLDVEQIMAQEAAEEKDKSRDSSVDKSRGSRESSQKRSEKKPQTKAKEVAAKEQPKSQPSKSQPSKSQPSKSDVKQPARPVRKEKVNVFR